MVNLRRKAALATRVTVQVAVAIATAPGAVAALATPLVYLSGRALAAESPHLTSQASAVPVAPALAFGMILLVPAPIPEVARLAVGTMRPRQFAAAGMLAVALVPWRSKPG